MRHDAKSLALFRAIYRKILGTSVADSGTEMYLWQARDWAARFSQERPEDVWLAEWVGRLDAAVRSPEGLEALRSLMLSTDQHAIDMRSSSPFAMVLTTRERTQVLLDFEQKWREGQWDDGRAA